jgi:hypothetical protein
MLRSPKARVKGRKAGSPASSFWFLMSALAESFVGGSETVKLETRNWNLSLVLN